MRLKAFEDMGEQEAEDHLIEDHGLGEVGYDPDPVVHEEAHRGGQAETAHAHAG